MNSSRRGVTLIELLLALVLAALVSAMAVAALAATERNIRRSLVASGDRRSLHEADLILAGELRATSGDSLRLRGDTAVEFLGLVGTSVVCSADDSVIILPPAETSSGIPYSLWRLAPDSGDLVAVFDTSRGGQWRSSPADSVTSRTGGAACSPSSGLISAADSVALLPVSRIRLRRPLGSSPSPGDPVRIVRRARYTLLRGADRQWTLSYRRCGLNGGCGTSQPVVGSLASASDSGVVFVWDALTSVLSVTLRAPLREGRKRQEVHGLSIVLRNRVPDSP